LDIPKFLFKVSLWSWFLYRTGEELFYYILRKFNIPHTPKWKYDYNLKYSDNMANKERWKKSKLFEPATLGLVSSTKRQTLSTASGKDNGKYRAIQNK
jgi:hypothetical protein